MGLSNEERFEKFYWTILNWRRKLVSLQKVTSRKGQPIVKGWIRYLDQMVGLTITKTNRSGGYWLLGSNEGAFQNLFGQEFNLGQLVEPDEFHTKFEYDSARYWNQHFNLPFFVSKFDGWDFKNVDGVTQIAHFWDQWTYVDAVLYPVLRYNDNLFPKKVRNLLTQLMGEMANRRFDLCFDYEEHQRDEIIKHEQAMLAKFRYAERLIDQAAAKEWELERLKKKVKKGSFNIHELCWNVGRTSLADVEKAAEEAAEKKRKQSQKYHEEQYKKDKAKPKMNGILGPIPTPEKN
jgi:hypothetical protein